MLQLICCHFLQCHVLGHTFFLGTNLRKNLVNTLGKFPLTLGPTRPCSPGEPGSPLIPWTAMLGSPFSPCHAFITFNQQVLSLRILSLRFTAVSL